MAIELKLQDYPFSINMQTRWRDLDAFGHVNNAVFATYVETARIELFNRWDISQHGGNRSIIAASLKLDYLQQLSHPSTIQIDQNISRIGTTSFDIQSTIFLNKIDSPICTAVLTCVCFDYEKQISIPVFDEIKADSLLT